MSSSAGAGGLPWRRRSSRTVAVLLAILAVLVSVDAAVVKWLPRQPIRPPALAGSPLCDAGQVAQSSRSQVGTASDTGPCPGVALPAPRPARATAPVASLPIGPANRWAVLVGVQTYAGSTHPTFGGRGDIAAVHAALLRAGWRSDHILSLIDGEASGAAILQAMTWLAHRSGPQTFTLFHFSGHVCIASRGPCPSGHAYLWGQDNTFLSEAAVGSHLNQVQGRAWFDFAGCEAGAFDAGLSSTRRLVTGSSQASETAYEEPSWRESVWTGLVWDRGFLHGEDGAPPAQATIGQMVAYGRTAAAQITATQSAGTQHPYVAGGDPTQTLYAPRT